MSTTNILDLNNRIDALEKNSGGGGSADSAKRSDIATEFSATTAYTAGCFVYYEGKLYQFNADHAAGAWDPTDVVEANVTDQVVSNASAIAGLTASDVAYGTETVKDALDDLTASTLGTAIDVSSATSKDKYTTISDGYLIIQSTQSTGYVVYAVNDENLKISSTYSASSYVTIYVKKGMQIWKVGNNGSYEAKFYPLT